MHTIKAGRHAYITFGSIWGALSIIGFFNSPEHLNLLIHNTLLPLIGVIPFYIWLLFFKISISDSTISYRCLLGSTKIINRNSIIKYEIKVGELETLHDRIKPFIRLKIFVTGKKEPALEINLKVFDRQKMRTVFDVLDADIRKNKTPNN